MTTIRNWKINLFSGDSYHTIDNGVFWLNTYVKYVLPDGLQEGFNGSTGLAQFVRDVADVYGEDVFVTTTPTETGFILEANGSQVCFLEFGTGVYANEAHPYAGAVGQYGVDVGAGTWSLGPEGEKKYLDVLMGKVDPYEWEYNKQPRTGMLNANYAITNYYAEYLQRGMKQV